MKLRLVATASLVALLAGYPALAQDEGVPAECTDIGLYSMDECNAYFQGGAAEEPTYEEPAYEEPAYEEPAYEEPTYEEPVYEEPAPEEPVYDEPTYDEPAPEEPAYQDEAVPEEDVYQEPAPEEPMIEDDVVEPDAMIEDQPSEEEPVLEDDQTTEPDMIEQDAPADEQAIEDDAANGNDLVDDSITYDQPVIEPLDEPDPLADLPPEELADAVEPLDGVSEQEASPLLDSAKTDDYDAAEASDEDVIQPENDEDAQVFSEMSADSIVAANAEQGEVLDAAPQIVTPQNVTIINNVENTYIYEVNNVTIINNSYDDRDRVFDGGDNYAFDQIGDNRFRETLYRDDGSVVVTVRDQYGNILERYVTNPDGSSYVLAYFDPGYYDDLQYWGDPGYGLPPLRLTIALRDYVLDWRYADADAISVFFRYPPVEPVRRVYSIDEVKRSARLRDSVRRLEVNDLNFASGSAELSRNQINGLERLATAILTLLDNNPGETFLIEGHTDAKGSDQANLLLSDKRASNVARILTQYYGVPPENLATQGYGERYLRVNTQRAEPQNRRVTIRRITPLITPHFAG